LGGLKFAGKLFFRLVFLFEFKCLFRYFILLRVRPSFPCTWFSFYRPAPGPFHAFARHVGSFFVYHGVYRKTASCRSRSRLRPACGRFFSSSRILAPLPPPPNSPFFCLSMALYSPNPQAGAVREHGSPPSLTTGPSWTLTVGGC